MDAPHHRHALTFLAFLAALVAGAMPVQAAADAPDPDEPQGVLHRAPVACTQPIRNGEYELCAPSSLAGMGRGFVFNGRGRAIHKGVDVFGVGPEYGIGTPVRSMVRAKVVMVGLPEENPGEFGVLDKRPGTTQRNGVELPRSRTIPGYGKVHFFTQYRGRWRSGAVVITEGLGGGLEGHQIRYMHLAAVHPSVKVGSVVEAGQEIGLMGGTAVQQSAPHVHIDGRDPSGRIVNLKALLMGADPAGSYGIARAPSKGKGGKGKPVKFAAGKALAQAKKPAPKAGVLIRSTGARSGKPGLQGVTPVKVRPDRKRTQKTFRSS